MPSDIARPYDGPNQDNVATIHAPGLDAVNCEARSSRQVSRFGSSYRLEAGLLLGLAVLLWPYAFPIFKSSRPIPTKFLISSVVSLFARAVIPADQLRCIYGLAMELAHSDGILVSQNDLYDRALVLTFGVLSVLATYLLGRAWGGQVGGLLAGGLLSPAASHIVVVSHVGWSNSITPLFTTLAVWALDQAVRYRYKSQTMLLISGLSWGLACTLILRRPRCCQRRSYSCCGEVNTCAGHVGPISQAGLFIVVNLTMIIYNLNTGFKFPHGGSSNTFPLHGRRDLDSAGLPCARRCMDFAAHESSRWSRGLAPKRHRGVARRWLVACDGSRGRWCTLRMAIR